MLAGRSYARVIQISAFQRHSFQMSRNPAANRIDRSLMADPPA